MLNVNSIINPSTKFPSDFERVMNANSLQYKISSKRTRKRKAVRKTTKANPLKSVSPTNKLTLAKSYQTIINDQTIRFDAINKMVKLSITGENRALIVSGSPGMGKTFDIMRLVKKAEKNKTCQVKLLKGYARATGLYKALYEYRKQGQLIIVDDCDSVFRDEVGLNILKAALDSGDERHISWGSESRMKLDDDEKVPTSFVYEGSMIFITNVCFDEEIEKNGKLSNHFEALLSRCHYIETNIKTNRDRLIRLVHIAYDGGMYDNLGISKPAQEQIIQWIEKNVNNLREISLRMAKKIGQLYLADPSSWKNMASVTCLKKS